jgi:hypothetical protein
VKAVLTKFTPYKGIGLYIGEHEVAVSQVASTPLGQVEIARHCETYEPEQLAAVVTRLVKSLAGSRNRIVPVALGICARRVFYSTRPYRTENNGATPQALLREVWHSPNVCIDEMTVEMVTSEFGKDKLASLVSCRTEYLAGLLKMLTGCGIRPVLTEPSPFALLRAGLKERRVRRTTVALRVFLSDQDALAMITSGPTCVLWNSFKLPAGREPSTLCSAIRSCQTMASHCGIDTAAEVVIVHGRPDLRKDLTDEEFVKRVGVPVSCCDGPELGPQEIAFGLALGSLGSQSSMALDLSRSMKASPTVWQIVPWGEIAVQIALVVCVAFFMMARWHGVEQAVAPVTADLAKHGWQRGKPQGELTKERDFLSQRVEAIRKFIGTRVVWARFTSDISGRLPRTANLTGLQGFCELEDGNTKTKSKKSLIVRASAPIAKDGSTPQEIDQFLNTLHDSPLLHRDFPIASLADIKWAEVKRKDSVPEALFTVICLAKPSGPPAAPGEHGGKEEHK